MGGTSYSDIPPPTNNSCNTTVFGVLIFILVLVTRVHTTRVLLEISQAWLWTWTFLLWSTCTLLFPVLVVLLLLLNTRTAFHRCRGHKNLARWTHTHIPAWGLLLLKTLRLPSFSTFEDFWYVNNDTVEAFADCTKLGTLLLQNAVTLYKENLLKYSWYKHIVLKFSTRVLVQLYPL
jgi:hypothetical protein